MPFVSVLLGSVGGVGWTYALWDAALALAVLLLLTFFMFFGKILLCVTRLFAAA